MAENAFFENAVRNLPGGLILVDLQGRIQAVNETAQTILGLTGPMARGIDCETALFDHPKVAKVIMESCRQLTAANRKEITTQRPDGEKIVLGYGTLILKDTGGTPLGVGFTFQDITTLIPLMDSHRFLDIALRNLPGGLIFVDLQGKIRGINQMAQRILGLTEDVEPGTPCHKALARHPHLYKVLLSTCEHMNAVNRQELTTHRPDGEKAMLGYGTLILRSAQGQPIGVGMTFQDITRYIPLPLQTEFIRTVNRFFTPFALVMVGMAMWLGFAEPRVYHMALALALGLAVFNEASVWFAKKHPEWTAAIGYTRLVTNFVSNVVLVYMLGTFWGPMWLLFVLTPVSTALYANWMQTLGTALLSAGSLLAIYGSRGLEGAVGWGQASVHAAFIVFISLFVNSIARMVMQIKSGSASGARNAEKTVVTPSRATQDSPSNRLAA
jgi:PAS domain S-box-containing protein